MSRKAVQGPLYNTALWNVKGLLSPLLYQRKELRCGFWDVGGTRSAYPAN